jgi:hypothetical protein
MLELSKYDKFIARNTTSMPNKFRIDGINFFSSTASWLLERDTTAMQNRNVDEQLDPKPGKKELFFPQA